MNEWLPLQNSTTTTTCFQRRLFFRYREKDSKFQNWIELPVNPPDARNIQIHNLNSNTRYEFQVIGTNEYGDGMYSEIIEAQTKGNWRRRRRASFYNLRMLLKSYMPPWSMQTYYQPNNMNTSTKNSSFSLFPDHSCPFFSFLLLLLLLLPLFPTNLR